MLKTIHNTPTNPLKGYLMSLNFNNSNTVFTKLNPNIYDEKEKSNTKNINNNPKKSINNAQHNLTMNLSNIFSKSSSNWMSSYDL